MQDKIKNINARQILDSRGTPTISVEIELNSGLISQASVPSGASTGINEAYELRDDEKTVYMGRGVLDAVKNVKEKISKALIGTSILEQRKIDEILIEQDGTQNKKNLGANAILGVSLASARLASKFLNIPLYKYLGGINGNILPTPMVNILNGGVHADNNLEFQEFMITPTGADSFHLGLRMAVETFYSLKEILKKENMITSVGDEGGFAPNLNSTREALDLIIEAINKAGYSTEEIKICLDVASSEFYNDGIYEIKSENLKLNSMEMATYIQHLIEDYPIISVEDPMAEQDYEGWKIITNKLAQKCLLVGDDLFTTNVNLLAEGIENDLANAILIKPNQIGTLTETLDCIKLAKINGYKTIISHRSGETEDSFISDLAVGVNSGLIKTGSITRSERNAKYNRLLEIEGELNKEFQGCRGDGAKYLGYGSFNNKFLKWNLCNMNCNKRN